MYFPYIIVFLYLNLSSVVHGKQSEPDYDGWLQLRLWHAINDDSVPEFMERGNITISSVRSGTSTSAQIGLQQVQVEQLKTLAKRNGQYRLKVIARSSSGSESTFFTSIPACYLLGSDLEDALTVWLDSTAEPIAVSVSSPGTCKIDNPFTKMWTTDVIIKYPDGGPVPDTATYIQKLEKEREARERGEAKDNRSFLAKYWMYIVPALIFVILTSATNPEAGAGGGGGSQRQ